MAHDVAHDISLKLEEQGVCERLAALHVGVDWKRNGVGTLFNITKKPKKSARNQIILKSLLCGPAVNFIHLVIVQWNGESYHDGDFLYIESFVRIWGKPALTMVLIFFLEANHGTTRCKELLMIINKCMEQCNMVQTQCPCQKCLKH